MKNLFYFLVLLFFIHLILLGNGCSNGNSNLDLPQEEIAKINELFKQHVEYGLKGNMNAIVNQYSDNPIRFPPGEEIITSREVILAGLNQMGSVVNYEHNLMEVEGSGNMASVWVDFKLKIIPPGGSDTVDFNGKSLTVLKKADNEWKLHRVMWN